MLNSKGEIDQCTFQVMLQRQLCAYVQRQISVIMKDTDLARRANLGGVKMLWQDLSDQDNCAC